MCVCVCVCAFMCSSCLLCLFDKSVCLKRFLYCDHYCNFVYCICCYTTLQLEEEEKKKEKKKREKRMLTHVHRQLHSEMRMLPHVHKVRKTARQRKDYTDIRKSVIVGTFAQIINI